MEVRNITNIELIDDFVNMSTQIRVKCKICGSEYNANPQRILNGYKCRYCALRERKVSNIRKTHEEFISELKDINKNIYVIDKYINAKTNLRCRCMICGNEWSVRPTNLLNNKTGCPKCANKSSSNKQLYTLDTFKNNLYNINPNIEIIGIYKGNHIDISCRCKLCGNIWCATPANLLRGTGCPKHNSSHGEKFISEWLDLHNILYIHQKKFSDLKGDGNRCLPYDFYIPDYNFIIEYQGSFHDHTDRLQTDEDYEIRKRYDDLKREYAVSNNYIFIEIWYYDNIEEKLLEMFNIIDPVTTTA